MNTEYFFVLFVLKISIAVPHVLTIRLFKSTKYRYFSKCHRMNLQMFRSPRKTYISIYSNKFYNHFSFKKEKSLRTQTSHCVVNHFILGYQENSISMILCMYQENDISVILCMFTSQLNSTQESNPIIQEVLRHNVFLRYSSSSTL